METKEETLIKIDKHRDMIFCIGQKENENEEINEKDGIKIINFWVESYVNLSSLSNNLRQEIRKYLKENKK